MAKKDRYTTVIDADTKMASSPYEGKSYDELIEILSKKDDLLGDYTTEISKLRKQVEECGAAYDESQAKSLQVMEKYEELEKKFDSYKAELDSEYEAKAKDQEEAYNAQLAGQKEADEFKFKQSKEAFEADIAGMKESHSNEIANLKNSKANALEKQKASLQKEYDKKVASLEKKHASEVNKLNARIKELEALSTEGVFSEKLRKRFLDASKKAINDEFDRLAEEAEAEVSDKRKVQEAVNKANNRLKWLKEQQDHNAAETEELMSLLKELTGDAEA